MNFTGWVAKRTASVKWANRSINFDIRIDVIMQPVQHQLIWIFSTWRNPKHFKLIYHRVSLCNICWILDSFEWNKHRCTYVHYEEFILVDVVTLLYKWNEILNGIYIGLYTNAWIDWRTYENDSQMYWSE